MTTKERFPSDKFKFPRKPRGRMLWEVDFYHSKSHKLRFRQVSKRKVGKWRQVAGHDYWKLEPGQTSGLPKNLFVPLNDAITGALNKTFSGSRVLPRFRKRVRKVLIHAADKVFRRCSAEEESKTRIKWILHHKPFMHFVIVNFQEHSCEEFYKLEDSGAPIKGAWGKPRKDLGRLAAVIRKDRDTGLRELEHESSAVLRWAVVFFANGKIWLVPGKSRKERR